MRCPIEPKSLKGTLKNSTAIFSGEVLEIRSGVNFLEARFRVERSWKGVEAEQVQPVIVAVQTCMLVTG